MFDGNYKNVLQWAADVKSVPQWIRQDKNPAQVLQTAAGWYIGTTSSDGMPYARWTEYIATEKLAKELLKTGEWKKFARPNP